MSVAGEGDVEGDVDVAAVMEVRVSGIEARGDYVRFCFRHPAIAR